MKLLAFLALAILCDGCQVGTGSPSPSATQSASESAPLPSSIESVAVVPFPAVELPPQSRARLDETLPAFQSPGDQPSREVPAGTEVVVVSGPRERGGETWYAIEYPLGTNELALPWVRIADPAAIAPIAPTCPSAHVEALGMVAWDRLTCIGSAPVTVVGQLGHCQGGVVQVEPEWLGYACWGISIEGGGYLAIHAAPTSGISFPDELVRARLSGHFDDAAAISCRSLTDPDNEPWQYPGTTEQVLLCREAYVVDAMEILEVIGTPPVG